MNKQKFLFLFIVLSALFMSCRKQYSCQCSITIEKPGYYPFTTSEVQTINKKTTKKRAEEICAHSEKQLYKNTNDYTGPDEKLTTSCAVK